VTPAELDERLHEWARYVTDPPASRQSLVQSIYTFKLDDAGRKQAKPLTVRCKPTKMMTAAKPLEVNPRAEATETAVAVLRSVAPDLGLVVVAEYLSLVPSMQSMGFAWRRIAFDPRHGATGHLVALARGLGISSSAYRHRLKRAHVWLERYFAVVKKAA
jgi:hypothetical protein